MTDTVMTPADPSDALTFETTVTLEDLLALQMRCLASPALRAGRLRRDAVIVLIAAACAPLALAGGVLIAWAGNRGGLSPGQLLRTLVLDEPGVIGAAMLVMVVCTLGGVLVQRWLARPWLRRMLRRILRTRPDVDPSDPHLAYRATVTANDEGLESQTGIGKTSFRWNVLKRWVETGPHLMVLGDAAVGFCVRLSAVDPASLDRFRSILAAQLGPKDRAT